MDTSTKRNLFLERMARAPHGSYLLIVSDPERAQMLASLAQVMRPDLRVEWLTEEEPPRERWLPYSTGGVL